VAEAVVVAAEVAAVAVAEEGVGVVRDTKYHQ
jgi:hypothetical protein